MSGVVFRARRRAAWQVCVVLELSGACEACSISIAWRQSGASDATRQRSALLCSLTVDMSRLSGASKTISRRRAITPRRLVTETPCFAQVRVTSHHHHQQQCGVARLRSPAPYRRRRLWNWYVGYSLRRVEYTAKLSSSLRSIHAIIDGRNVIIIDVYVHVCLRVYRRRLEQALLFRNVIVDTVQEYNENFNTLQVLGYPSVKQGKAWMTAVFWYKFTFTKATQIN